MEPLPFRQISAFWVEIHEWRLRDSLPFSPVSHLLGRDFRTAATGISTFFRDFRILGRDFQPTILGISTFSAVFRYLGRDFRTAVAGLSTYFLVFRHLGRDFQAAVLGIFTFSADFRSAKSVVASFCSHVITCTSICTKIV